MTSFGVRDSSPEATSGRCREKHPQPDAVSPFERNRQPHARRSSLALPRVGKWHRPAASCGQRFAGPLVEAPGDVQQRAAR